MKRKHIPDHDDTIPPRGRRDPGSIADGDSPLGTEPPNVTSAEPPSPGVTRPPGSDGPAGSMADDEARQIESDLDEQRREFATLSDRHVRLAAEFDNYRKRVERERADTWVRAQGDLARRLLDALDDLERVSQYASGSTAEALLEGVQLVERKLRLSLEAAGLEEVDALGEPFDPNSMEAVAMVEAESQEDDEIVGDVFQRGYRFKGNLLRPARVRVKKHGA